MTAPHSRVSQDRRLPDDILEEIFHLFCWEDDGMTKLFASCRDGDIVDAPALTLSWVCSRWRCIVHASPRLWSSFCVDIWGASPGLSDIINLYLTRSEGSPIDSIYIVDSQKYLLSDESTEEDVMEHLEEGGLRALTILLLQVNRCRQLSLCLHPVIFTVLEPPRDLGFLYLHTFRDETDIYTLMPEFTWLWEAVRKAPRLAHLHVAHMTSLPYVDLLPFRNIVSMDLRYVTVSSLLEVLPPCKCLESLRIWRITSIYDTVTESAPDNTPSFELPSLLTLEIYTGLPLDSLKDLFASLELPALESFEVTSVYEPPGEDDRFQTGSACLWPTILTSTLRSVNKLKTLLLSVPYTPGLSVPEIVRMLHSCPSLISLNLRIRGKGLFNQEPPQLTTELCTCLTISRKSSRRPSSAPVLVPHLQSLVIREPLPFFTKRTAKRIYAMVESRSRQGLSNNRMESSVSPLESVTVVFSDYGGNHIVETRWHELEALRKRLRGMGSEYRCDRILDDDA